MKLSLIIPVYKAQDWICRCLDSILHQIPDAMDCEVICIVDGSPDNSANLIREYQNRHENIILHVQENKGVSAARNKGIELAEGEFITFIDSDDTLSPKSLQSLFDYLDAKRFDVGICRSFIRTKECYPWTELFNHDDVTTPKKMIVKGYDRGSVWGCVYNRALLMDYNIRFIEGVSNGEDSIFFSTCMCHAKNVAFFDVPLYNVFEEDNSLSRTYKKERSDRMIEKLPFIDDYLIKLSSNSLNGFITEYIRYSYISGIVSSVIKTDGIGLLYILEKRVNKFSHINVTEEITLLRNKMRLMNVSLPLYYLLSKLLYIFRSYITKHDETTV